MVLLYQKSTRAPSRMLRNTLRIHSTGQPTSDYEKNTHPAARNNAQRYTAVKYRTDRMVAVLLFPTRLLHPACNRIPPACFVRLLGTMQPA